MKISRENYEIWFLDFMEGRLNRQETEEVRNFMTQHPDLAEELENFVPPLSSDSGLLFPGKEKLKKELFDDPKFLENSIIARMEGDLNETENKSLEDWLNHHTENKQYLRQFENTRLKPDFDLVFPGRERLKKNSTLSVVWIRVAAIAAIILMVIYLFYPERQTNTLPIAAIIEKPIPSSVNTPIVSSPTGAKTVPLTSGNQPVAVATILLKSSGKSKSSDLQNLAKKSIVERSSVSIPTIQARTVLVNSFEQEFADLMPVRDPVIQYAASNEILMSSYLTDKFHELKSGGAGRIFSREGLAVASLRFFSWLPGRRLTGKKGSDGRLKSITFNTQLLAFSIPVNRGL